MDKGHKIHIKVPLHFVNQETAPGVKLGHGLVSHVITELDVECLPGNLPEFIEVDLGELQLGQSIHVNDLKLGDGVEPVAAPQGRKPGGGGNHPAQGGCRRGAGCRCSGACRRNPCGLTAATTLAAPVAALRLIAGLGNPGPEYSETRHNAGFWFVDACARKLGAKLAPESRYFGEAARVRTESEDLWLLKPLTFMNRSGRAVAALVRFYKISPEEILVVHDELDLLPGEIRLKQGGGNGGHNGLKDLAVAIGKRRVLATAAGHRPSAQLGRGAGRGGFCFASAEGAGAGSDRNCHNSRPG